MPPQQPVIEEHAFKQTTTKRRIENDAQSDNDGDDDVGKVCFLFRISFKVCLLSPVYSVVLDW